MKRWWQNVVKDYFTFTARERNGLLAIAVAGAAIFFGVRYWPVSKTEIKKDAFQKELADLKISIDSSRNAPHYNNYRDDAFEDYSRPRDYNHNNYSKGETFAFDPNTLDAEGWKKLGVRDKTIGTIQNFLSKGYKFRNPEDIRKIYGLRKEDADRLVPYVRIAGSESHANNGPANAASGSTNAPAFGSANKESRAPRVIDVNMADTAALISLPGIGSKLASRIVTFRDKLGGFTSVNQVSETFGLPDSTFQKIKSRLQVSDGNIRKININTAEVDNLRTHPYLRWNIANAIVNYRKQHGNYKSIDELRKIDIINEDLFNKIAPYLVL